MCVSTPAAHGGYVRLSFTLRLSLRQRTQSDVAVFGAANVDSEHICLAMEERSLQGVGDARGVAQILCRFIEHTVAITAALFRHRKREKNDGGIDVEMNGPLHPRWPARFSRFRSPALLARPRVTLASWCVADLFRLPLLPPSPPPQWGADYATRVVARARARGALIAAKK